jgi:DNA repair ATPase RecN
MNAMSSQGLDGVVITPDTINEHLQRIADAEAYIQRFGAKPQQIAYLTTLHEQSSRYLAAMQTRIDELQKTMSAYEETLEAVGEKQR